MEEEILDVVDEKDRFVRKATRKEIRKKVLLHRVSRIIIKNDKNEFLVHRRSKNKKTFPNYWDIGIAETVKSGESYEAAAIRGLAEEVGIIGVSNTQLMHSFLFKIKYNSSQTNEHCKVYEVLHNGKITAQEEEIDDIKYLTIKKINDLIGGGHFHPLGKLAFERYLENKK